MSGGVSSRRMSKAMYEESVRPQRNAGTGKASHPWDDVISQRISKALSKYLPVAGDPALYAAVHAETCKRFRSMIESSLKDVDSALEDVVTLAESQLDSSIGTSVAPKSTPPVKSRPRRRDLSELLAESAADFARELDEPAPSPEPEPEPGSADAVPRGWTEMCSKRPPHTISSAMRRSAWTPRIAGRRPQQLAAAYPKAAASAGAKVSFVPSPIGVDLYNRAEGMLHRFGRLPGWLSRPARHTTPSALLSRARLAQAPTRLLRTSSPLRVSEDQEPLPPSSGPGGDRQPSAKVQQLADQICELTMLEVADLTKLLKGTLDIPDAAMPMGGMPMMMGMGAPAPGGGGDGAAETEAEPEEEQTEFDVKLEAFDSSKKISLIKEVRAATSLGLKESKELVEGAPKVVAKGLVKEDAEELAAKLNAAGGTAVVE